MILNHYWIYLYHLKYLRIHQQLLIKHSQISITLFHQFNPFVKDLSHPYPQIYPSHQSLNLHL
jgi:hypothetical protein